MGRITTFTHVTLDGVMQAPGRPDEDTRDGFGVRRLGGALRRQRIRESLQEGDS
jgi:hypothetical protein